jgi:hypothetical protein
MESTFDLKKFLVENKLTYNSRIQEVDDNDSELDAAMKAGLSALSSGGSSLTEITDEEQPKQLNESATALILSGLLAAPKIVEWIAKGVGAIAKLFRSKGNPDDPAFIEKTVKFAHKWEKLYINAIIWVVKKTKFVKDIWMTADGKVDEQKLLVVAKYIYAAVLALAIGNAVGTVLGPGSALLKGIEGALGSVKAVEIVQIAAKVKGQL